MTTRIKVRRDTSANWTTNNPVLALGEPGLDTDANQVKYGDGITAWNDLAFSSGAGSGGTANRVQAVYWSESLGLYTTTTADGIHWTNPITMDFEWGPYGVNQMATGPLGTVYTYGSMWGNYLGFQPSPFETPMACQPQNVTHEGINGEDISWNKVQYVGGYYIAVGNLLTATVVTSPFITIPYWAYSADGKNWTVGRVNAVDMENIVDTENGNNGSVVGLEILDVAYNGTGWLFCCEWINFSSLPSENPGAFYITNIGAELSSANYSTNVPFLTDIKWAGSGWVGMRNDGEETILYSIQNTNPLATTWSTHDFNTAVTTQLGPWSTSPYYAGVYGIDTGMINNITYTVITTDNGRALVTTDLGATWHAVVPDPKTSYITAWTTGTDGNSVANVPIFSIDYNGSIAQGEKFTVTGAKVAGMNGVWYIGAAADPGMYFAYRTVAMDTAADTTGWGIDSINITTSMTYGSRLISVSSTTNLHVGMWFDGPGNGKITAIDQVNKTITVNTTAWEDFWDLTNCSAYPMVTFSNGQHNNGYVVFNDSGYFLIEEYINGQQAGWSKSTDPINSWNDGQSYDPGLHGPINNYDGLIAVSSSRVTLPVTSWSYTNPMYNNSASVVSLTDKFQVNIAGGGRWDPPCSVNLVMDPLIAGWSLGASTDGNWGGDLGTVSSYNSNNVVLSIHNHYLGVDWSGKIIAPSLNGVTNARTNHNNLGTGIIFRRSDYNNNTYQKLIGTENGDFWNNTVERLVITGGDSYYDGISTWAGEGGDIYLWAGAGANGGDIKIDAGASNNSGNEGGTIKIRAGVANGTGGNGGYLEVYAGDSTDAVGGLLDMKAGSGAAGGNVQIYAGQGSLAVGGNVTIGAGIGNTHGGNVILTILGTSNTWTFDYNGGLTIPGTINYTPATAGDWAGTPPNTIQGALDRLAAVVKTLNGGTGA